MSEKVKIRIAVAVYADGSWNSCGDSEMTEADMLDQCLSGCIVPSKVCFINSTMSAPVVQELIAQPQITVKKK